MSSRQASRRRRRPVKKVVDTSMDVTGGIIDSAPIVGRRKPRKHYRSTSYKAALAPKRPLNAYMRYAAKHRAAVMTKMRKSHHGKHLVPAVGKELGRMYRAEKKRSTSYKAASHAPARKRSTSYKAAAPARKRSTSYKASRAAPARATRKRSTSYKSKKGRQALVMACVPVGVINARKGHKSRK